MESYTVKILKAEYVTHDVRRFTVEKPPNYTFEPGQATEVTIKGMEEKVGKGPFTFTSLKEQPEIEFTIKIYEDGGLTKELGKVGIGDELILHDVWGTITYRGPGVFIAGGAGVTPFIAILKRLHKDGKINSNKLIFSNKTEKDIILKDEFEDMLGNNFINVITKEKSDKYFSNRIDEKFIKEIIKNFNQYFYICGPKKFVSDIMDILKNLGVDASKIVIEK
jgi:ferredoxin-NADP reductase